LVVEHWKNMELAAAIFFAGFEREGRGNDRFALAFFLQVADEVPVMPVRRA
jgi:hypothetical protein